MEPSQAQRIVIDALLNSYEVYSALGSAVMTEVSENQFGDLAIQLDIKSEAAIIGYLKKSGINFALRSEEHGNISATDLQVPSFLAVLDGLDGSSAFKKDPSLSWAGCMFALFDTDNPRYGDYLAAGIVHFSIGLIIFAVKGQGVHIFDISKQSESELPAQNSDGIKLPVFVDLCDFKPTDDIAAYGTLERTLNDIVMSLGYKTTSSGSSAEDFTRHLFGQSYAVVESTRKGNLEFATAYAIIHEAGGAFLDIETGEDIGHELFLQYGQKTHKPIVASRSPQSARLLVDSIRPKVQL